MGFVRAIQREEIMSRPKIYYTTARLAEEMGTSQTIAQKMVKDGKVEGPDILLKGVGLRNPSNGYTIEKIKRIVRSYKMRHGK